MALNSNPFSVHGAISSSHQHRRSRSNIHTHTFDNTTSNILPPADSLFTPAVTPTFSGKASLPSTFTAGNSNVTPTQHSVYSDTQTAATSTPALTATLANQKSTNFEDIVIKPQRAALTLRPFPKSIPLSVDEESFPSTPKKKHQRSTSALLPSGTSKSSHTPPTTTPSKRDSFSSFLMPFTGDKDPKRAQTVSTAGWFTGSSDTIPLGISNDDDIMATADDGASMHSRRRSIASTHTIPQPPSTTQTRFPFFSKAAPTTRTVSLPASDPFLTLSIPAALFPHGVPSDRDPFSPSAFKNLLANAEGLLSALQSAYIERTASLSTLTAEQAAQKDELEEAETRAAHLKQQLEDMARRVEQQDEAMVKLVQDMAEQKASIREREKPTLECVVVRGPTPIAEEEEVEAADEDLDVRRASHMSDMSSSASFESDGEESIFSRARSPTIGENSVAGFHTPPQTVIPEQRKPSVVGRIFGTGAKAECKNCKTGDARFAWDAVKTLRVENKGLRERVVVLEGAVESVLDLVR